MIRARDGVQNELEGLKRRYQDIEIALKARQQAFLEGFKEPEDAETSKGQGQG